MKTSGREKCDCRFKRIVERTSPVIEQEKGRTKNEKTTTGCAVWKRCIQKGGYTRGKVRDCKMGCNGGHLIGQSHTHPGWRHGTFWPRVPTRENRPTLGVAHMSE